MIYKETGGSSQPGSTCIVEGTRAGKDFSATLKPCSSNKQPDNSKRPIFCHQQETLSSHLHQQHKKHHGGGIRRGAGVVALLLLRGIGDTNRQSVHPLRATWLNGPYAMQTRVPSGSVNRRLAPQGRWGDGQDSGEGRGGRFGLREAGEASARQDGRHLLHHVLGSHGDKTDPPSLPLHPNPYSSRWSSTHSPRAHSMVADRRGWWGRGLAALLRLPAPAFRLSALHICRTKAMFMLHL